MKYRELLKKIADYGHGVFSITMLDSDKQRDALKHWIYRNPQYFRTMKGTFGDIKLCALTKEGMVHLSGNDTICYAESWASFIGFGTY